jgi:hypothetical protein
MIKPVLDLDPGYEFWGLNLRSAYPDSANILNPASYSDPDSMNWIPGTNISIEHVRLQAG